MRVVLVHTNRERAPYPAMPLGACLVASAVEAAWHEVRLLDLCFSRRSEADLERVLLTWQPEAIGLSIRNLDNGESRFTREYLPGTVRLAHLCREVSAAPLIIGGPAVSILPRRLLELTGADYAVIGDGEAALPALLGGLARGDTSAAVPGVLSRGGPDAAPARLADLVALPPAQLGKWLDVARYLRHGAPIPVQSRRGCGFACTYCTYRFIEGTTYRLRSPEVVAEEIADAARRFGARRFDFVDSTFNRPAEHAAAVCEAILRAGVRAELHSTDLNPWGMTRELLALMQRAGFGGVVCTPESGSERMLAGMRKGFTCGDIVRLAEWTHALGVPVLWMFMFGAPGECEDTVRETVRLMEAVVGPRDRAISTIGLRVYPGTELERIAREEGALPPNLDLAAPVFYFSDRITPVRVLQLLDSSSVRSRMVYLETLQERVVAWSARAKSALGLRGPLWSALPWYNRVVKRTGIGHR